MRQLDASERPKVQPELVTNISPYQLKRWLAAEVQREAVVCRTTIIQIEPGLWAVEVYRLKPRRRPAWQRRTAVAGGAVAGLVVLAVLGWWAFAAVSALFAGVSLTALLGGGALVVLALRAAGGCETTVTVRHRH